MSVQKNKVKGEEEKKKRESNKKISCLRERAEHARNVIPVDDVIAGMIHSSLAICFFLSNTRASRCF